MSLSTEEIKTLTDILVDFLKSTGSIKSSYCQNTDVRLIQALALYDAEMLSAINHEDIIHLQEFVLSAQKISITKRIPLMRSLVHFEDKLTLEN
jgi:hypothetical protein